MYNTLSNKIPKAPVVGSLFSAEKQIRQWEKSNNLSSFLDKLEVAGMFSYRQNFILKDLKKNGML